jgi:general secretion pathway protein A
MYTTHFGLTEPPFAITPDPRYLYMSPRHREAMAHLRYGVTEPGGFVLLTGEVGTGKTTLCRSLLEQIEHPVDVALVLNPCLTSTELLAAICDEFHVAYAPGTASLKTLVDALHRYLLDTNAVGRRAVLIVDEAQHLAPDVLEQVRLLTNLETSKEKLLQVILIGQPELADLLDRQELRQVAQRVTARYHLLPFSDRDTHAYVRHRLSVAGARDAIFTPAALRRVHELSKGVPRLINIVCDRALLGAYASDRTQVDAVTVVRAAREVRGDRLRPLRRRAWVPATAAAGLIAVTAWWSLLGPTLSGAVQRGARLLAGAVSSTEAPPPAGAAPAATQAVTTPPAPTVAVPAAGGEPARIFSLAEIIQDGSLALDRAAALTRLYARWGLDVAGVRPDFDCQTEAIDGVFCHVDTGTWAKLRRLDVPAVIELLVPPATRRYVTVVAVTTVTATLDIAGRDVVVPIVDIDLLWDGGFTMLWRRPPVSAAVVWPGMRGADVAWLQRRLAELDGQPAPAAPVFDKALIERVKAFQTSRGLFPDGIVGQETLFHLSADRDRPDRPRLSARP